MAKLENASPRLPRNGSYVPELDTFRLLAILSVMCIHWLPDDSLFNRLQGQTSNGVHLFFVLSGYLITGILLRCRLNVEQGFVSTAHAFRQFYIRRFLRIFPLYYLALALGVLLHFEGLRRGLPWHVTYTSNFYYFFRQKFGGPASLFWTLAVEEQFYLLWPLAMLMLPRRWILPFVAAVAVLCTALRVAAVLQNSWLRILTPWCMNFLAVGALLAVAENTLCGSTVIRQRLLRLFGLLSALLAIGLIATISIIGPRDAMDSPAIRAINQPLCSLLYACLFAWACSGIPGVAGKLLRCRPLVYLGRISYGLYVYHLFVSFGLPRAQPWLNSHLGASIAIQLTTSFAARFAVTVAIASLSWFLFENPLNQLKRHFPYVPRQAEPAILAH